MGDFDSIILDSGDIVYDTATNDWGVLLARKLEYTYRYSADGMDMRIWVWDMFWAPYYGSERYTEESLFNMIEAGRLVLHKNDD